MFHKVPSLSRYGADVYCVATTAKAGRYIKHFHAGWYAPHIHESVKALQLQHVTDEHVISSFFPNPWPPLSPDLIPCDFWLWDHLKSLGSVATLNDLKNCITLHVSSVTTEQLRSAVEHTVNRFENLQVNECGHIEYFSLHRPGHD